MLTCIVKNHQNFFVFFAYTAATFALNPLNYRRFSSVGNGVGKVTAV